MTWHPGIPAEYQNAIVTGDARELAKRLPDESVDLIFCDPVYWQLDDYLWLGREAARVLKPGGSALIWTGTLYERPCLAALEVSLQHRLTLNYVRNANTALSGPLKTFLWRSPLFWMGHGECRPKHWIPDTVVSRAPTNGSHAWNKNPEAVLTWLQAFADEDEVVWDPFTGGGTVPAVCKQLRRNYVAFELDPETATLARERIRRTPLPLLIPDMPDPQGELFELCVGPNTPAGQRAGQ